MEKVFLLVAFVLLLHGAVGSRIKRQLGDKEVGIDKYDWNWHRPNLNPNKPTAPTPNSGSGSESIILRDCLGKCPVTTEYNPVCGTNNVTYDNPGRLLCAQSCGINVKQTKRSRCSDPSTLPPA